ncbi:response regulator [Stenomitos frigidus]|uniref:histidine kinase n=1 Tax=Stenomitos frigidus ULC18 TaxID=2107698 RepID=A0A2T1EC01_9CYAN|nr:response regulator [Stenomitos frigidus]PSB30260.1 histidine kinase [Stenomitos frigidus ULC18]
MGRQQHTILIVDDSPEDREFYRRCLRADADGSYTVLEAALGQQGLALWHQHHPDVVLLDYRLPDLDGLEFLAQLGSLTQQPCLPVIVVTGQGNEAIAVQAIKAGAQDYLIKAQITPEGLKLAVNGTIEAVRLRLQLQQRIERERVVAQITRQIHQSLDLDRILHTTVTEVQQFLHTDRVLVFRLEPDGNGTVVAEAVGSEWRSLLASTIYDPCLAENYLRFSRPEILTYDPAFAEDYVQRYRQGRVTAIADIQDSSIDPCHVELLASFQVKANLVVPILHDDQFWGLLIAHHCAAPRLWQPVEIDLLKELATQVSIALRQAELYQQSQTELAERQQAEASLRESESRLRLALEASRMGTWDWNIQTGKITWSENLEALFGLTPGGFDGSYEMFVSLLHSDDRDRVLASVQHSMATGDDYNIEFRVVYPNGAVRWALTQGKVFYDPDGRPVRMAGIDLDITDRKRSAEALQESEARFRQLAEKIDAVFWLREEPEGRVSYVSPAYERLWGWHPQELYENQYNWVDHLHPDDRDASSQAFQAKAAAGQFDEEYRIVLADGSIRWVHDRCFPLRDETGKLYRFVGIAEDITDRRQAQELLRLSEERYRTLFESMEDGFCVIEMLFDATNTPIDYRFLETNLAFAQQTGLEQAVGKTARQLIPGLEDHWYETYGRVALTGEPVRFENGAEVMNRWFDVYAFPIEQSESRKIALLFKDISERKLAEQEREQLLAQEQAARAEAERANRIKDEFLAVLSHELRSPLNPILGWTKLLQTRKFDEARTAEALATIERNARLQTQLIDDLLDVAKILRGKLSMETTPIDLVFVVESAIDTVRTAAISKTILLHPVLPQIGRVSGDSARLQQVVWNLLSNAIKFTPNDGRVDILLERVGNWAQIIISDTGKGINPDFLPHLFESFRQEDASTTRQYGGLGLGLAIVRSLVEAHGGTIAAASPGEGQGATFTIRLPLLDTKLETRQPAECCRQNLDLTGIRVLAVDDEPDARELLNIVLTQYGAEVLMVNSAADVLTALETFRPDALISDIGMPEVDGYTLIQQIRKLPLEKGGQIPAIALTAYAREDDRQRALASGYQQYVTKPLDPEQLVQAVIALCIQ